MTAAHLLGLERDALDLLALAEQAGIDTHRAEAEGRPDVGEYRDRERVLIDAALRARVAYLTALQAVRGESAP